MVAITRRTAIQGTGAAILPDAWCGRDSADTAAKDAQHRLAAPSGAETRPALHEPTYLFLNADEAAFIEAAVARLIPKDDQWGGAVEAGVPSFIDKQLAGAWGAGERLYRSGPWKPGTPGQGYQLPFTPAELFRTALGALKETLSQTPFAQMSADQQDEYLASLERGGLDLGGVPSDLFFAHLLEITLEGYFGDPVYGGNRNMVSWRMIGFPGAYASYYDLVDQHGIKIDRPPMSLAEDARGIVHMDPGIPARSP